MYIIESLCSGTVGQNTSDTEEKNPKDTVILSSHSLTMRLYIGIENSQDLAQVVSGHIYMGQTDFVM